MFRRVGISFILLFSFLLIQGHNLIPHHHYEDWASHSATHHHHGADDADGEHHHSTDPCHSTHETEIGKDLVKAHDFRDLLQKPALACILTYWLFEPRLTDCPKLVRPPVDPLLYSLLLPYSVPLRAPPAFLHFSA